MSASNKISDRKYTIKEYLALEEVSVEKKEYHNGEVWAMSGGTRNHGKITLNIGALLFQALREKKKNCSAFGSELKIHVEAVNAFLYPDAMVICGEEKYALNRLDMIQNPLLIVEVLSKSTEAYDRGAKFRKYRSIPSFKEYILIDQNKAIIEGYYKETKDYWRIQCVRGLEESIYLHSIDCTIRLSDIYWQVVLENNE